MRRYLQHSQNTKELFLIDEKDNSKQNEQKTLVATLQRKISNVQ